MLLKNSLLNIKNNWKRNLNELRTPILLILLHLKIANEFWVNKDLHRLSGNSIELIPLQVDYTPNDSTIWATLELPATAAVYWNLSKRSKRIKTMGKKNSKLKQDTIDRLTTDTYCKYCENFCTYLSLFHLCWNFKRFRFMGRRRNYPSSDWVQ